MHSSIAHAQGQARTLASQCRATLAAADQRGLCCQAGAIEPRGEDTSSGNHGSAYLERVLPGLVDGAHHGRTAQASRRALLAPTPTQAAGPGLRAAIYAGQYGTLPIPNSWQVGVNCIHLHVDAQSCRHLSFYPALRPAQSAMVVQLIAPSRHGWLSKC